MTLNLYKFYWDCGRMGDLDGLFVATQSEVDQIMGKNIYFGEVLGKHSDIDGVIEPDDITLIAMPEESIKVLVQAIGSKTISGYNPLSYYEPEEDNDDEL